MWWECGIYGIANTVNGMIYVGETEAMFGVRWRQHRAELDRGKSRIAKLQKDWLEYGVSVFDFQVLEVIPSGSPTELFMVRERYYLKLYLDRLYNRNGRGGFGRLTNVYRYLESLKQDEQE